MSFTVLEVYGILVPVWVQLFDQLGLFNLDCVCASSVFFLPLVLFFFSRGRRSSDLPGKLTLGCPLITL